MGEEPRPPTDCRQIGGTSYCLVQALVDYQSAIATRRADPATLAAMGSDPGMQVLAARLKRRDLAGFRRNLLLSLSGAGSIALGLTYVLHAYGPTEAEVVCWGRVSVCLGLAVIPLAVSAWHSNSRIIKGIAGLGCGVVALLQNPPILLWFAFHGSGISDGTPPSAFVAHWAYAIPHLAVLAASVATIGSLLVPPMRGSRPHGRPSCQANASGKPEMKRR